ncbi:1-deoxy-D-xylulose-5-phosphate reductoisomerase [Corynebacterium liangguodongii]|uniref:1-deoxy-D-xylulose 5-phosphate reductoisomerase n=1 Tax=Corynebacterium liangguodongii TaxID=2079535 RepID=A0A2S0WF03_9CORY|nr:1-deoxy-D-xylulose-5-phosphate reductoisomerase [Corynebacterium liangguodongii]AWB84242.1 1-deoxy-D-xylulose-5-phosphate reductoisomerase [Corynebacterium liangguodongii]PWC00251.1 1-deoxy-D-xylulose-5-phosphate reductoisomerase [Corynebacterium liangguodongii]
MAPVKRIVILGSTGSIGTQALEVIAAHPDRFEVVGIAAGGRDPAGVVAQARALGLRPHQVAVSREAARAEVAAALGAGVLASPEELVAVHPADTVLNALVGSLGLASTLAVLDSGASLALANKESLVAGGQMVLDRSRPGQIVPVDSEHSAIAQCLRAGHRGEVARLVLTASGGPFRGRKRAELVNVTPQQAAAHPTWSMGQMNTLNSATLVNKGLELIEAALLFGIAPSRIDVTVHPQSVVHSMVTFCDGATIAQASPPSMKLPIAHALAWPERVAGAQPSLDFTDVAGAQCWEFAPLDHETFPAVALAREVATAGQGYPAVYNAANEEAAAAFLAGRIRFPEIVDVVAEVVAGAAGYASSHMATFEDVVAVESQARRRANERIEAIAAGTGR